MDLAAARQVPVHLGAFVLNWALTLYVRLGFVEIDRTDTHVILRWQPDGATTNAEAASDAGDTPGSSPTGRSHER